MHPGCPVADVADICDAVKKAAATKTPLKIVGGGSKDFYGNRQDGELLDISALNGIVDYDATAKIIIVRAATLLSEVEETLSRNRQILPFEPPHFGETATVGGAVACGFSGPRRPLAGAIRDYVGGVEMVDGNGQKRVGGVLATAKQPFDLSPLMAGAMGTLGVMTTIALRVAEKYETQQTAVLEMSATDAQTRYRQWRDAPLGGTVWCGGLLFARLCGRATAVAAADIGGEKLSDGEQHAFWRAVREQTNDYFLGGNDLWRWTMPPDEPAADDEEFVEWHGAVRWRRGTALAANVKNGAAILFRAENESATKRFPRPLAPIFKMQQNLKRMLDPADILNRGRWYDFNLDGDN